MSSRCPSHDLALSPDGRCVVCRRAEIVLERRRSTRRVWTVLGILAVVVAAIGGVRLGAEWAAERLLPDSGARVKGAAFARPSGVGEPPVARSPGRPPEPPVAAAPAAADAPPADTTAAVERARRDVRITLYGAGWCPACRAARRWLDARAIVYDYRDVEASAADQRRMRQLNPRSTIPTIDVEGQVLVGFDGEEISHAVSQAAKRRVAGR